MEKIEINKSNIHYTRRLYAQCGILAQVNSREQIRRICDWVTWQFTTFQIYTIVRKEGYTSCIRSHYQQEINYSYIISDFHGEMFTNEIEF